MRRGSGAAGQRGSLYRRDRLLTYVASARQPRSAAVSLGLAVLLLGTLPSLANGQSERCVFQITNVDRQGAVVETPQGTNYFAGGNVQLSCRGLQVTMRSDSVAAYGGNVVHFIGNVQYRDSTLTMDADKGIYYKNGEKWEARGRVTTNNLRTGSKLSGPALDYYRVVKGVRDTMEMYSTGRPKIEYVTQEQGGRPGEPYIIVADRVRLKGNDRLWAGGKVTIDRSDFSARGDSLRLDTGARGDGTLLGGMPLMRGLGQDSFSLTGRRLDLKLDGRELTHVTAKGSAHAVSKEWDLVADTIGLDIENRRLEQTLAWGDSTRPYATSPAYAMRADSLALDTPGQQLKEVRGFGTAWLGGTIDTRTKQRDWIRGDTVVAQFVQRDSAETTRAALNRIVARKNAQSFHLDPSTRYPDRPSINYARGDVIIMTMKHGVRTGVDRVDVRGQVDGIQLEAADLPPADSLRSRSDTLSRARGGQ
ncbi:MAG TPA: hypothetical protein VHH32_00360 [Gemmatimonadales bacterium]|nr:hypothetical protein [Gemmatimonadales bacterium]